MPGDNLKYADDFALDYDSSVLQNNWIGPKVIFELTTNFLHTKSQILDLGIGTGESALLFQEAGHKITGLDGSKNMLEKCKQKKIGNTHLIHNLEEIPFPICNNQFDAVISNGAFHLIHPIKSVFAEIKRALKPNGYFTFTFEDCNTISGSIEIEKGIWQKETDSGVLTFKHSFEYIQTLLEKNNFETISQKQFLAFENKNSNTNYYFTAIVAQLQ